MRIAALALVALLTACGTPTGEGHAIVDGYGSTANRLQLADGTPVWLITCPGALNGISTCLSRASSVCNGSYRLVDRQSIDRGSVIYASTSALYGERRVEPEIVVSCNQGSPQ